MTVHQELRDKDFTEISDTFVAQEISRLQSRNTKRFVRCDATHRCAESGIQQDGNTEGTA